MPLCHNCRIEARIDELDDDEQQKVFLAPSMDPGETCDRCGRTRTEPPWHDTPDPAGSTGDHTRDPLFAVVDLLVWLIVTGALIWTLVIITL